MKLIKIGGFPAETQLLKNQLGLGVYTIPDVSLILGIPTFRVRHILNSIWDDRFGKQIFHESYSWNFKKTKAVNFLLLIEFNTFFHLKELGVSTQRIVQARNAMVKELNQPYPFASNVLLTNGRRIWYECKENAIDADGTRQTSFLNILSSFCERVEFNGNNLAQRYWPLGKDFSVVVDPAHNFGQPTIKNTNIGAYIIYSMVQSGEPIPVIRSLYDLSEKEVKDAIAFYQPAA